MEVGILEKNRYILCNLVSSHLLVAGFMNTRMITAFRVVKNIQKNKLLKKISHQSLRVSTNVKKKAVWELHAWASRAFAKESLCLS